jgi:predicted HNH restriction endonuclease
MVNMFDVPAQAQFYNTYVPIPFQQYASIAEKKDKAAEQAKVGAEAILGDIRGLKYRPATSVSPGEEEAAKQYMSEWEDKVRGSLSKYEDITKAIPELIQLQREWVNDPVKRTIERNADNFTQTLANQDKHRNDYQQPWNQTYDQELAKPSAVYKDPSTNKWVTSPNNVLNPSAEYTKYADFERAIDEQGKGFGERILEEGWGTNGKYDIRSIQSGVYAKTIADNIKANYEGFSGTAEGRNLINYANAHNINPEDLYNHLAETSANKHAEQKLKETIKSNEDYKQAAKARAKETANTPDRLTWSSNAVANALTITDPTGNSKKVENTSDLITWENQTKSRINDLLAKATDASLTEPERNKALAEFNLQKATYDNATNAYQAITKRYEPLVSDIDKQIKDIESRAKLPTATKNPTGHITPNEGIIFASGDDEVKYNRLQSEKRKLLQDRSAKLNELINGDQQYSTEFIGGISPKVDKMVYRYLASQANAAGETDATPTKFVDDKGNVMSTKQFKEAMQSVNPLTGEVSVPKTKEGATANVPTITYGYPNVQTPNHYSFVLNYGGKKWKAVDNTNEFENYIYESDPSALPTTMVRKALATSWGIPATEEQGKPYLNPLASNVEMGRIYNKGYKIPGEEKVLLDDQIYFVPKGAKKGEGLVFNLQDKQSLANLYSLMYNQMQGETQFLKAFESIKSTQK